MQINPLAAALTGRIDQTGERVRSADQGSTRARKPDAVDMAETRSSTGHGGSVSSLAHTSAEEFFALAEAGKVNANAPRGTYLNLLV